MDKEEEELELLIKQNQQRLKELTEDSTNARYPPTAAAIVCLLCLWLAICVKSLNVF